jgi:pyruvate,water dikinase
MHIITPDHLIANHPDPAQWPALVGGKAAALAALHQTAIVIPPWCVLTADTLRLSLPPAQRTPLEHAWAQQDMAQVRALLEQACLSSALRRELEHQITLLCPHDALLAVRSSARQEDGTRHSFAGQLESLLDVAPADVAAAIATVWRSAFSERVLAYHTDLPPCVWQMAPAVLVQQMVHPQAAGVAFSSDPVQGRWNMAVVAATHGLGESLVSGTAVGDSYHIDREGQVHHRDQAAAQPVLSTAQAGAVAHMARAVARLRGSPQDIEWALLPDAHLVLLQARPITTLGALVDPDGVRCIWDNSNIVESYGGVTTPLTFSFARRAYAEVYREMCRVFQVPKATIAAHDTMYEQMIGLVQGHIYYNLLNWYRLVALLPGYRTNRRFMEQMLGVSEELSGPDAAHIHPLSTGARLRDGLALLRCCAALVVAALRLPGQVTHFRARLHRILGDTPPDVAALRTDELVAYYRNLEQQLLTRWDVPMVNGFFAMIAYGLLRRLAADWCGDHDGSLYTALLSGEPDIVSAEPARRMREMSALAAPAPVLVAALCSAPLPEVRKQIAQHPAFAAAVVDYLHHFGERCTAELKLESPTLHDDPLPLLRAVGHLARQPAPAQTPPESQARQQAEAHVRAALRHQPLRRVLFGRVLRLARMRLRDRENLRFERTRVFGRARLIFRELGQRLHLIGRLTDPRDVFYLEAEEVLGFAEGTTTSTDLGGLAAVRRAEFAAYAEQPAPPPRFETRGPVHHGAQWRQVAPHALRTDDGTWQGTPCSPGLVQGRARIVHDPRAVNLSAGDILVAHHTDPGWVVLFPIAAGLLVERGNPLSHAAIVSREMGLPAVIGLPGITGVLRDGDLIEMDGSTGTVRRLVDHEQAKVA